MPAQKHAGTEEFAPGLCYDEVFLIGVDYDFEDDLFLGAGIADAISYSKVYDQFYRGVDLVDGRPEFFPGPGPADDGIRELIQERHPWLALWVRDDVAVPSFPGAVGVFFSKSLADLLDNEADRRGIFDNHLYSALDSYFAPSAGYDDMFIGFGRRDEVVNMFAAWYDILVTRVDRELSRMYKGRSSHDFAKECLLHLSSLSPYPSRDISRTAHCAKRLLLMSDDDPDELLSAWDAATDGQMPMTVRELERELGELTQELLKPGK